MGHTLLSVLLLECCIEVTLACTVTGVYVEVKAGFLLLLHVQKMIGTRKLAAQEGKCLKRAVRSQPSVIRARLSCKSRPSRNGRFRASVISGEHFEAQARQLESAIFSPSKMQKSFERKGTVKNKKVLAVWCN